MTQYCHTLLITGLLTFVVTGLNAESKQVYLYQLPQQQWDVRHGDSLSKIATTLLPNNHAKQQSLMQSIVDINPDAFINQNPNRLRANIKLILPAEVQTYSVTTEDNSTHTEHFSWGSIKRRDP